MPPRIGPMMFAAFVRAVLRLKDLALRRLFTLFLRDGFMAVL